MSWGLCLISLLSLHHFAPLLMLRWCDAVSMNKMYLCVQLYISFREQRLIGKIICACVCVCVLGLESSSWQTPPRAPNNNRKNIVPFSSYHKGIVLKGAYQIKLKIVIERKRRTFQTF